MLFDECPPYPCERHYAEESTALTTRWAERCRTWHADHAPDFLPALEPSNFNLSTQQRLPRRIPRPREETGQLLFGIVQGSTFADLREQSARDLASLDFDGYAIGGVSVGEPEEEMIRAVDHAEPFLPAARPRYAMGLGTPPQMLEMIARGVDLFDCVHPTPRRPPRTGLLPGRSLPHQERRLRTRSRPPHRGLPPLPRPLLPRLPAPPLQGRRNAGFTVAFLPQS